MSGRIALVTDSTASLSDEVAGERGITVVPLQVVVGATSYDEGVDDALSSDMVTDALREWQPVSTSRPNPESISEVYADLVREGVTEIVSVHLSGEMSGTVESAETAAAGCEVPVHVVDARQVGAATGFAVLAAADALDAGASAEEAAAVARRRGEATRSMFYVDTLEYLRKGGRIGHAQALVGLALAMKPLLQIVDGKVAPLEKVRTTSRALGRLADLTVEAAGDGPVDVAVAHLANPERAEGLASRLTARLEANLEGREILMAEIGAVLGAHVGPGMVAVAVAPRE